MDFHKEAMHPCGKGGQHWAALGRSKEVMLPLSTGEVVPGILCSQHEYTNLLKQVQQKATKRMKELEHLLIRKGWGSWDCSASRQEGSGRSINVYKFQLWGNEGEETRLLSGAHWQDKKQQIQKKTHLCKYKFFHLNTREHYFAPRVVEHWNRY